MSIDSASSQMTRREISARANELGWTRPRNLANLVHLVVLTIVLAGLATLALSGGIVVRLLAWSIMAFLLLGAAALAHEAVHGQVFTSKAANYVVGTVAGLALIVPWAAYVPFHLQHHVHTARAGDPEGVPPQLTARWQLLAMPVEMVLFVGSLWIGAIGAATVRPPFWARSSAHCRAARISVAVHAAVYTALVLIVPLSTLAVVWFVPAVVTLLLTLPLVLGPEHLGAPIDDRDPGLAIQVARTQVDTAVLRNDGPVDQLAVSRWVRSNALVRLVYRNHNYHNAHHFLPAVTAANLPRVEELIVDRVPDDMYARSYSAFYRKLWRSI